MWVDLADLAIAYEAARGGLGGDEVVAKMVEIVRLLRASIREGIAGTAYDDRILGAQGVGFREKLEAGHLLEAGLLNAMILQVTALMEVKSSMGVIVAAPTAGACGTLPGAVLAAADALGKTEEEAARAMLAAGLIGVFIAARSSFAAEVGGCQAETGSGASMAAAALVTLHGGPVGQAVAAASIALQNTFGMICDPVANRVEAPCLGKNIMGAANALSCANIALADFDPLIPFDEVIDTHYAVGNMIPHELRCTRPRRPLGHPHVQGDRGAAGGWVWLWVGARRGLQPGRPRHAVRHAAVGPHSQAHAEGPVGRGGLPRDAAMC